LFATGNGEYGKKTFSFLDPTTLEKQTTSGESRSGTILLGYRFGMKSSRATGYLLAASYTWKRTFEAGDEVQLCSPFVGSTTKCGSAVVGEPSQADRHITRLEGRLILPGGNFGLNPAYIHTREGSDKIETSAYVLFDTGSNDPIYPVVNNKSKFAAGATLGWDFASSAGSTNKGLYVFVFVGPVFRLGDPISNGS
jgi:hypothetical protein